MAELLDHDRHRPRGLPGCPLAVGIGRLSKWRNPATAGRGGAALPRGGEAPAQRLRRGVWRGGSRYSRARGERPHVSPPLPICFSSDCRTSPITYGSSVIDERAASVSPFPQRPRPATFLQRLLGSLISANSILSERRSRLACGITSTKFVSALYAT